MKVAKLHNLVDIKVPDFIYPYIVQQGYGENLQLWAKK